MLCQSTRTTKSTIILHLATGNTWSLQSSRVPEVGSNTGQDLFSTVPGYYTPDATCETTLNTEGKNSNPLQSGFSICSMLTSTCSMSAPGPAIKT
jgi:hypothetical protein